METDFVHQLIHDESRAGHVAGVLHYGYEEVEYQYVRQEYEDAADSGNDAVDHEIFQPSVRHDARHELAEFTHEPVDPLHRVVPDRECCLENQVQNRDENRERKQPVRDHRVDLVGDGFSRDRVHVRLVGFCQCPLNESVFGVHYRGFRVGVHQLLDSPLLFHPRRDDLVPVRECVNDFFYVLVVFQVFDGQIPGRVFISE